MKSSITILLLLVATIVSSQDIMTLVSPFQGSTELGDYNSRFGLLTILTEPLGDNRIPSEKDVNGEIFSRVFERPDEVTPYEIHSSYKRTLEAAEFDILLNCKQSSCNTKMSVEKNYGFPKKQVRARKYEGVDETTLAYLISWGNHYLSAKKETAENTYYVMVIVSDEKQLYSVDVVKVENMEEGTVTLAPELLQAKIESDGKAVLDGIYFETGKDIITSESEPAISAITTYLRNNSSNSYYVVGHTDDTGDLENNLSLSERRAVAVINALNERGISPSQLVAQGVGPFSPAATNQSDIGKSRNRRVELVLRLHKD